MKRAKNDSVAHAVRSRILRAGPDRLWTYADFPEEHRLAVSAALSRLTRAGEITRVRRGVYYRPKVTRFGLSKPDPGALVDAALRQRGVESVPSGAGEYNRLGLTSQLSSAITRASARPIPHDFVPGVPVHLAARPLHKQRGIRPDERTALDALRGITHIPDADPSEILFRLKMLLRSGKLDFARLVRFARAEPPRVRALLGALGDELRAEGSARVIPTSLLAELRIDLNPLTTYKIPGVTGVLRNARAWRIK